MFTFSKKNTFLLLFCKAVPPTHSRCNVVLGEFVNMTKPCAESINVRVDRMRIRMPKNGLFPHFIFVRKGFSAPGSISLLLFPYSVLFCSVRVNFETEEGGPMARLNLPKLNVRSTERSNGLATTLGIFDPAMAVILPYLSLAPSSILLLCAPAAIARLTVVCLFDYHREDSCI